MASNYNECKKEYSFYNQYDDKIRWIQYHTQIDQVLKLNPKKVLEIGIGSKVVSDYLNRYIKVHTFDINRKLNPDTVGSVESIEKYFKKDSFDLVLCSQMLEHLPFEKFESFLRQIRNITKKYVVLSLPYSGIHLRGNFSMFHRFRINFNLTIPKPVKHIFYKGHYWEIGKKNFSKKSIRRHLENFFKIKKEFSMQEDPYYRFYILEKKNE